MTRRQQGEGGRKEAWDSATRREVMRRAKRVGAEKAGAAFGVPSGTVRSWLRRAAVKAADDDDVEARLAEVQRQGRLIVQERERQLAEREAAEREAEPEPVAEPEPEPVAVAVAPKRRRRRKRREEEQEARPPAPVVNVAQRQLDGSDDLPPYELHREDGSVQRVSRDDPDVGPYARRQS
jgi:hypothetical protein